MSSNYRGNGPPPETNPVLSGYESFVESTPLVTRYVMTTQVVSWCMSWFVDPSFAISNIPLFTVFHFEMYRIALSPLVCTNLLTLIFAFMSFTDNGKRLEYSMGSTAFVWLILTIGVVTNLVFLVICLFLYWMTAGQSWLVMSSQGIWTILLGIIAIECANAPEGEQRRLFFLTVPTKYYPLAILCLFSLFVGPKLDYLLSVGVGHAYGHGFLDKLKLSNSTFSSWEDGCLNNFTQRKGFVVAQAASGPQAWLPINNPNAQTQSESWSPASFFQGQTSQSRPSQSDGTIATPPEGGWSQPGNVNKPKSPVTFSSKGQTLGGSSSSSATTDQARAARLAAVERRNTPKADNPSQESN